MNHRALLLGAICAAISLPHAAQEMRLPEGKWWQNDRVVRELGLSQDQIDSLDTVAEEAMMDLIDLKAEMQKASLELRRALDRDAGDVSSVREAIRRVNRARSALFEREVLTLVGFRSVLTDDQWDRMRQWMEMRDRLKRERSEKRRPGPGDRHRPGNWF